MAELFDKPLYEVVQNGTLEQVTEAVDAELKSLGNISNEHGCYYFKYNNNYYWCAILQYTNNNKFDNFRPSNNFH